MLSEEVESPHTRVFDQQLTHALNTFDLDTAAAWTFETYVSRIGLVEGMRTIDEIKIDLTGSNGFPWIHSNSTGYKLQQRPKAGATWRNKGEWLHGTSILPSCKPYFVWWLDRAARIGDHEYPELTWYGFPKHEILPIEKANRKTRLITAAPVELALLGDICLGKIFDSISCTFLDLPHTLGFTPYGGGWNALITRITEGKMNNVIQTADIKQFDGHLMVPLLEKVRIFFRRITNCHREDTPERHRQARLIDYLFSELRCSFITLSHGGDFFKEGGNNSGTPGTTYINTIAHEMIQSYNAIQMNYKYWNWSKVKRVLNGDDVMTQRMPDKFWESYNHFGMTVTVNTGRPNQVDYLSHLSVWTPLGYVCRPKTDKALYSLMTSDHKHYHAFRSTKCASLYLQNFWGPYKHVFEKCARQTGFHWTDESIIDFWTGVLIGGGGFLKEHSLTQPERNDSSQETMPKNQASKPTTLEIAVKPQVPSAQTGSQKKKQPTQSIEARQKRNRNRALRRKRNAAEYRAAYPNEADSTNKLIQSVGLRKKKLRYSSRLFIESLTNPCGDGNVAYGDFRPPDGSTQKSVPSAIHTSSSLTPTRFPDSWQDFTHYNIYTVMMPLLQDLGFSVATPTDQLNWQDLYTQIFYRWEALVKWDDVKVATTTEPVEYVECLVRVWSLKSLQGDFASKPTDVFTSWRLIGRSCTIIPNTSALANEGNVFSTSFATDVAEMNARVEASAKRVLMAGFANDKPLAATEHTRLCNLVAIPEPLQEDLASSDAKAYTGAAKDGVYTITRSLQADRKWISSSSTRPCILVPPGHVPEDIFLKDVTYTMTDLFDRNHTCNIILLTGINKDFSATINFHTYSEFQATSGSVISQFNMPTPAPDPSAIQLAAEIHQHLASGYPAAYNERGMLGGILTNLISKIPVVGGLLGNLAGGLADSVFSGI